MLLAVAAVVVSLVMATSASGNFPQSIAVTIPSQGEASAESSPLPPTATSAAITVTPSSPADNATFDEVTKVLAAAQDRKSRVLACVYMYVGLKSVYGENEDTLESDTSLQLLFLNACLAMAFNLSQQQQQSALAASQASAACPRQNVAVAMQVTSSGGKYRAHLKGRTRRAAGRSPLVVSCQHLATGGIQISLRARVRGRPLAQVLGPMLVIGFLNRSTGRSAHVNTMFSVR